jgi:hypothetical protein
MKSGAGITSPAPTRCSSCPPPNPFSHRSRRPRTPGSPRREPRECGSGSKNAVSLSLRFGLPSMGFFCWPSFDSALRGTALREARGASRGNAVPGAKTRFPSACASGFKAWERTDVKQTTSDIADNQTALRSQQGNRLDHSFFTERFLAGHVTARTTLWPISRVGIATIIAVFPL